MSEPEPRGPSGELSEPAPRGLSGEQCHDDVCITCSDTAVQVRVVELRAAEMAVVETESGPEEVSVALVTAAVGDIILVHAGEAIAVVTS